MYSQFIVHGQKTLSYVGKPYGRTRVKFLNKVTDLDSAPRNYFARPSLRKNGSYRVSEKMNVIISSGLFWDPT